MHRRTGSSSFSLHDDIIYRTLINCFFFLFNSNLCYWNVTFRYSDLSFWLFTSISRPRCHFDSKLWLLQCLLWPSLTRWLQQTCPLHLTLERTSLKLSRISWCGIPMEKSGQVVIESVPEIKRWSYNSEGSSFDLSNSISKRRSLEALSQFWNICSRCIIIFYYCIYG